MLGRRRFRYHDGHCIQSVEGFLMGRQRIRITMGKILSHLNFQAVIP